jgi:hypothetical protein
MPSSNEDKIAAVSAELLRGWGGGHLPGIHTDPIFMEYLFEGDPAVKAQLGALRLNAAAKIYRAAAEATESAAKIVGGAQTAAKR